MLQVAGRAVSSENILDLRRQVAERPTDTQIRTCLQLMHFENNVRLFIGRRLRTILEGEEPVLESSSSKKKVNKRKVEVIIKELVDSLSRGALSKKRRYLAL